MATENTARYLTLSDLLDMRAGDCMERIAVVAPAIERVVTRSGLLDLIIDNQGAAASVQEANGIVKGIISALLKHALGDCREDMVEIVAAINGTTPEELKAERSGWELVKMVKAIVTDQGFFTSARSLMTE